jgi:hypothetical protein
MSLQQRLATVLHDILPVQEEEDGAVTVHHDDTFASLRVVTIAEGLDMVSLTQMLAWDLPLDSMIRGKVAKHTRDTLLGTVSLVEKRAAPDRDSEKTADVLLRYNFPAGGLGDDALRTLILMVLATGADVRRALVG